jgi:hypothetical protein
MSDSYDLGTYSRPMTTTPPDAQLWFDRGLLWCYRFNHEESVRCFRKAAEHNERCAMAYWLPGAEVIEMLKRHQGYSSNRR